MEGFLERFGYRLEPRANISNIKVLFITLLAILFAFFVTAILIASFGVNPFNAYSIIIQKTLFNFRGFSEVLRKSIPLMLAGVGLVLAFRAQFWNIGAEGQILAGALAASGLALFVHLPAVIMIPAMFLLIRGSKDAGEETLKPRPDHKMYGGIYEKMRHPQAVGESVTWLGGAFLLNSPFLVLYSLIWLPIYYLMCRAEEKDLVLRFGQEYVDYMQRVGFLWPKKRQK